MTKVIAIIVSVITPIVLSPTISTSNNLQKVDCPFVSVQFGPEPCCASPLKFVAQISDSELERKVSYQWTVSVGEIVSGQGTSSISVVAPKWHSLTATVEVKGLTAECASVTASMTSFREPLPPTQLLDQFGDIPFSKVKHRLDGFAYQLRQHPGAQGYIVVYGQWDQTESSKNYLLARHSIETGRIVSVRKKARGRLIIKLYLVAAGGVPPVA
jgi:hypothetical protein